MGSHAIVISRRLNVIKMSILPMLVYGFNIISVNISAGFLIEFDKLILKFI